MLLILPGSEMSTLGARESFDIRNALRRAAENPLSLAAAATVVWPCGKDPKDYVPEVNTLPVLCSDLHAWILVQVILTGGSIKRVKDTILALTASYPRTILHEDQLLVEVVRTVVRMARVEKIPWAYQRVPDAFPLLHVDPRTFDLLGIPVQDEGSAFVTPPTVSLRIRREQLVLSIMMPYSAPSTEDGDSYDPLEVYAYWSENQYDPYETDDEDSPAASPRVPSPPPIPVCRWCETALDSNGACTMCAEPVCKWCEEPLTPLGGCQDCAEEAADEFAYWRAREEEDFTVAPRRCVSPCPWD